MFIIVAFIVFWYVFTAYNFLKQETRRIIHGLDMSDKSDALYFIRRKGEIEYDKNNKMSKKIADLILTYIVALFPLLAGLVFLCIGFD